MAKAVEFEVGAKDTASATLDHMVKNIVAQQKQLAASFRASGIEVEVQSTKLKKAADPGAMRLAQSMGLGDVAEGFNQAQRRATQLRNATTSLVPALGALGAVSSVAAAGHALNSGVDSMANMYKLAEKMGVGVDRLSLMQNALRLTGASAEAANSGLEGLQQTMRGALYGGDAQSAGLFRGLGIDIGSFEKGAHRAIDVLPQIAREVKRLYQAGNPDAAGSLLTKLGLGRNWLEIMKDGEAGLLRYEQAGAKAGTVTQEQADAAFRLRTEQERLSISLQSFGYQLAGELAPDLIPVVREMTNWVETNKDWLSHDIAQSVHDFITYLKNGGWQTIKADIAGIVHETDDVITKFGSWKTAIEVLGAAWALNSPVAKLIFEIGKLSTMTIPGWVGKLLGIGSVAGGAVTAGAAAVAAAGAAAGAMNLPVVDDMGRPGPVTWGGNLYGADSGTGDGLSQGPGPRGKFVPNLATSEQKRRAQAVYDYYRSKGWSDAAALGAVSNLQAESSMNDRADNGSHYGIGQWDANRQAAFRAWSGIDIRSSTFDEQMRFGEWELHNGDPKSVLAGQIMRRARTPGEAARAFSHYNERPGSDADDNARAIAADRIGDALQRHDVAGSPSAPSSDDATGGTMDQSGRIKVEVIHRNPPPGASIQVTTPDSPHMDVAPPLTVQSMPNAGRRDVARQGY